MTPRRWAFVRVVFNVRHDPMKGPTMIQKIKEAWKAIVALLIPIAFGAAAEMIGVISEWVGDQGYVWGGVAVGVLSSVGVWLKRNADPA